MSPQHASLARHLPAALRTLVRPRTYFGVARELVLSAFHVAAYPLGVPRPRRGEAARAERLAERLKGAALADDPATARMPVVLVHGYVHNRSAFLVMSRALKRAGFEVVHGFNYNPLGASTSQIASDLAVEVDRVLAATGASRCQLVGHSMGGIICRYYVQELGGDGKVDTVVTLGAPHRGTYSAFLGVGPACAELRPGSTLVRSLEESARPGPVRWISYYADLDLLVTPAIHGKLVHPALGATNIRVRDTGHMSMLITSDVLRSVVEHLSNRELGRTVGVASVTAIGSAHAGRVPVRTVAAASRSR